MARLFQVLSCYNCEMFQVHHVKKSTKWQCCVCNEKQSMIKAFKVGAASECRAVVQELNIQKKSVKSFEKIEITSDEEEEVRYEIENNEPVEEIRSIHDEKFSNHLQPVLNNEPDCQKIVRGKEKNDEPEESTPYFNKSMIESSSLFIKSEKEACRKIPVLNSSSVTSCMKDSNMQGVSINNISSRSASEIKKRSLEEKFEEKPCKKNRGFQLIVQAASKLK